MMIFNSDIELELQNMREVESLNRELAQLVADASEIEEFLIETVADYDDITNHEMDYDFSDYEQIMSSIQFFYAKYASQLHAMAEQAHAIQDRLALLS